MSFNAAQGGSSSVQPSFGPIGGGFYKSQGKPSGYDADAKAYFDAHTTALTAARKTIYNQFFKDIKGIGNHGTDDIFSKLDALWIFATETEQGALLDIKRGFDATAVNSPTHTADEGYAGDGSTSYVNLNFTPSTDGTNYTQNSAMVCVYMRTNAARNAVTVGGTGSGTGGTAIDAKWATGGPANKIITLINQAAGSDETAMSNPQGLLVVDRQGVAEYKTRQNGTQIATDPDASDAATPVDLYAGAYNNNGTAANFDNRQLALVGVGGHLTATEHTNLFNAIETMADAVGWGVVS